MVSILLLAILSCKVVGLIDDFIVANLDRRRKWIPSTVADRI